MRTSEVLEPHSPLRDLEAGTGIDYPAHHSITPVHINTATTNPPTRAKPKLMAKRRPARSRSGTIFLHYLNPSAELVWLTDSRG